MDNQEEEQTSSFELKDIQYALVRSWFLIAIVGILGLAGGIYAAASQTNFYSSKAQLLLRMGARESITQEDMVGAQTGRGREVSTGVQDEIHMLTDPDIYENLARKLTPKEILAPADPTRYVNEKMSLPKRLFHELQGFLTDPKKASVGDGGSATSRATDMLMKNTVIRAERFSNVISVFHTSSSPEKAQRHCEAILEAFIERHLEQYSTTQYAEESKARSSETKRQLDIADADYFAHLQECGNISVDTELDDLTRDKFVLEEDLRKNVTRTEVIAAEMAELYRQLAQLPETVEVTTPEVTRTSVEYDAKVQQRADWLIERENVQFLNITNEAKDQRIKVYDQRIEEIDQALAELDPIVVVTEAGLELVPNEAWIAKKNEIDALKREAAGLAVEIEKGTERVAQMEEKKDSMLSCKRVHKIMSRKVEELEDDYARQASQYEQIEALASIDLQGKTNLQVLKKPNLPIKKAGPARAKLVLVGMMGGLMFGAALAFLRQLADPRLRHPHVATRSLNAPLIAVVSEKKPLRTLSKAPLPEPSPAR